MLKIIKVSGPLVTARIINEEPKILETVFVGNNKLLGEIINIDGDIAKIQVYEETLQNVSEQPKIHWNV